MSIQRQKEGPRRARGCIALADINKCATDISRGAVISHLRIPRIISDNGQRTHTLQDIRLTNHPSSIQMTRSFLFFFLLLHLHSLSLTHRFVLQINRLKLDSPTVARWQLRCLFDEQSCRKRAARCASMRVHYIRFAATQSPTSDWLIRHQRSNATLVIAAGGGQSASRWSVAGSATSAATRKGMPSFTGPASIWGL